MEDVLAVYHRPSAPRVPQVCLDETSTQRGGATRTPLPAAPGRPARIADAYARRGVRNLLVCVAPLRGWRHGRATARRTKRE